MPYLNVDEIESALQNLAAAYPRLRLDRRRTPARGPRSRILRVGTGGSDGDGVLLLGGMHAREWVPPDALVSLAADLLEA